MLCVDGSSRSSYQKYCIYRGCFLHRWWTVVNFCRLFIPWSGLRLKFQEHCNFVDSVPNWLFWLERTFMVFWYFEDSCWNLGRFSVGRRSLDCGAPAWVRWIVHDNGCLGLFSFITIFVLNYWVLLLWFTGSGLWLPTQVLYFLLLIKTYPVFFYLSMTNI